MSEKPMVYGKIMRETKYLAMAMIELMGGDMMVCLIIDKENWKISDFWEKTKK